MIQLRLEENNQAWNMTGNPQYVDLEQPMSLLCHKRPYLLSPDGLFREFFFRPSDLVSVLVKRDGAESISNELTTFSELASLASLPHVIRLPGTSNGKLTKWHLGWDTVSPLLENGYIPYVNRQPIENFPSNHQNLVYLEWLDQAEVPVLDSAYVRKRLCEEHAHNLKAQYVPLVPSIGMLVNPETTAYLRLQSALKRDVDVDLSDSQMLFLLGILPSLGPSSEVSKWLKRFLPQILMPEILNLGRFKGNKFEMRLKNTVMQLDNYMQQNAILPDLCNDSGSSLSLAVYMPDARLVISIALGDAVVLIFDEKGNLLRHTYSLLPGDSSERQRIQQNGYTLEPGGEVIAGSQLNASRGLGLFKFKSTASKNYSRAYGAISSMPEISIQRLSSGEPVWLCHARASQLRRPLLAQLGNLIASGQQSSSQKLCNEFSEQLGLSDFMISKLDVGQTAMM